MFSAKLTINNNQYTECKLLYHKRTASLTSFTITWPPFYQCNVIMKSFRDYITV